MELGVLHLFFLELGRNIGCWTDFGMELGFRKLMWGTDKELGIELGKDFGSFMIKRLC